MGDQDPLHRAHAGMLTEFERKALIMMQGMVLIFYPFGLWYWWGQWTHMAHKPPGPLPLQTSIHDCRKVPFFGTTRGSATSAAGSSSSAERCASIAWRKRVSSRSR